jgi:hypothetical protein
MYNVYAYGEMLVAACSKGWLGTGCITGSPLEQAPTNISPYTYTLYMTLVAWYILSDWFTFKTSTNTTNISPYTYTLRQPVPSHEGERHVQCICIGRDVAGVCACSKGEAVRQLVPSHERHVQCICTPTSLPIHIHCT